MWTSAHILTGTTVQVIEYKSTRTKIRHCKVLMSRTKNHLLNDFVGFFFFFLAAFKCNNTIECNN